MAGWKLLHAKMEESENAKGNLQTKLKETNSKIKDLLVELQKLQEEKENLTKELKFCEEAHLLKELDSIPFLSNLESTSVDQFHKRWEEGSELDSQDISSLFSLFKIDHLFAAFKKSEASFSFDEILGAAADELQENMEIGFHDSVEMNFKLKVFSRNLFSVEKHVANCSICPHKNLVTLLLEYGLKVDENQKEELQEKIKDWKGFYFVTLKPTRAAKCLNVAPAFRVKLIKALKSIKDAHCWETE